MSDVTKGATVMVPGCRHDNVIDRYPDRCGQQPCPDCANVVDMYTWREIHPPPERRRCRGCTRPLLLENAWMADGCTCNSPRGVNHGLVATNTCTCVECDPKKTGGTRWPVPTPPEPPKSWVRRRAENADHRIEELSVDWRERLMRETVEECCRVLEDAGSGLSARRLRAMLEPKA